MRIACIMMQKNEDLLLEPWIRYHSYLFGIDNIFVLDNGSTSAVTNEILQQFESIGLNVDRRRNTPKDFDNKGQIVGSIIEEFRDKDLYDAVFPLDCDEFLAVTSEYGISCLRHDILGYLRGLKNSKSIYRIDHCLDNRPGFSDLFRLADFQKAFIPVANFKDIDHGFHNPSTLNGEPLLPSNLIHIHMHFKPYELVRAHARDKLVPFVDVDDPAALASFTGVGRHLLRYFTQSDHEYYADVGADYAYPLISYSGFINLLRVLMPTDDFLKIWCQKPAGFTRASIVRDVVDLPGPFYAPDYAKANPDVQQSGMDVVIHYCLFGFREERLLKPAHLDAPVG